MTGQQISAEANHNQAHDERAKSPRSSAHIAQATLCHGFEITKHLSWSRTTFLTCNLPVHLFIAGANLQPKKLPMNTDVIEKKILLRAPLTRIWYALVDSTEFGTWFGVKFERPFKPGALIRGAIAPTKVDEAVASAQQKNTGMPFEITVAQIQPERLFSFHWHPFAMSRRWTIRRSPPPLSSSRWKKLPKEPC
jgi:hypothetical protein